MYQSESPPAAAPCSPAKATAAHSLARVSLQHYRQSTEEDWLRQRQPSERHAAFKDFVKMPLHAEATAKRVVSRMNAADDERLLQATVDEDGKAATRAFLRSPDGCHLQPRHLGVSGLKFRWEREAQMRTRFRHPGRCTALFFLLLECACTPEALLKLQWDDIDLATGTVFLAVGSSGTFRPAAVSEFLCEVLSRLPRSGPGPFDLNKRQLHRLWSRISARADLGFLTLDELQTEGAWRLLEATRAAAFVIRPPHSPNDTTPGHAAIDDVATLQTELCVFASHQRTPEVRVGSSEGVLR
jgi:integrase